jgi:hypothetical protein
MRTSIAGLALAAALLITPSAPAQQYIQQWGCGVTARDPAMRLAGPRTISVPRDGSVVYAGEYLLGNDVRAYSPQGDLLGVLDRGTPGDFDAPTVAATPDGVMVGSYEFRPFVERFGPGGTALGSFGSVGGAFDPGFFKGVWAMMAGPLPAGGNGVILSDRIRVKAFSFDGTPRGSLFPQADPDISGSGRSWGEVTGLTASGSFLWLSSVDPNVVAVLALRTEGETIRVSRSLTHELDAPVVAIAPAQGGGVYVLTHDAGYSIRQYTIGGEVGPRINTYDVPGGFDDPRGIATDDAGNLYVADTGHDRIIKLGPGGRRPRETGPDSPRLDNCSAAAAGSFDAAVALLARQDPIAQRRIAMNVTCPASCIASVAGRVTGGGTRVRLKRITKADADGGTMRLAIALPRKAIRLTRRRTARGLSVAVRLTVTTVDGVSGAQSVDTLSFRLARV